MEVMEIKKRLRRNETERTVLMRPPDNLLSHSRQAMEFEELCLPIKMKER